MAKALGRIATRFVLRFWLFLLPWAVVALLPNLRQVMQLHLGNQTQISTFWQPDWGFPSWYELVIAFEPAASQTAASQLADVPLESAVRQVLIKENSDQLADMPRRYLMGWAVFEKNSDFSPTSQVKELSVQQELSELIRKHPEVKWLHSLALLCAISSHPFYDKNGEPRGLSLDFRLQLARKVREVEPDNAFPDVCEASWRLDWLAARQRQQQVRKDFPLSLAIQLKELRFVERLVLAAAVKPHYDEHMLDMFRCTAVASGHFFPQSLEGRAKLLRINGRLRTGAQQLEKWAPSYCAGLYERGQPSRALELSVALARLGSLMTRGRNTMEARAGGHSLLRTSLWALSRKFAFDESAKRHGQPALGAAMHKLQVEAQQVEKWGYGSPELRAVQYAGANMYSSAFGRELAMLVLLQVGVVLPVWFLSSCLLWRVEAEPSKRRQRCRVAVICAALTLASGFVCWHFINHRNLFFVTVGLTYQFPEFWAVTTLLAPPVLMWFLVALRPWFKGLFHHEAPQGTVTSDPDPGPNAIAWLQNHTPAMLGMLTFVNLGLILLLSVCASALNWQMGAALQSLWPTPLHAKLVYWLRPNEFFAARSMAVLAAIVLCLWILSWRFAGTGTMRAQRQATVRYWKESMGAYLVLLAWAYLLILVCYAPLRLQAERQVEQVFQIGEVPTFYNASAQSAPNGP